MKLPQTLLVAAIGLFALSSLGCQKKTAQSVSSSVPQLSEKAIYTKASFIAPADSVVSLSQLRNWLQCNPLLDSLSYFYQDSFKIKGATELLKFQEEFNEAQDRICVLSGFKGGYAEYLWIMKNLAIPKNRALLDSFKLALY